MSNVWVDIGRICSSLLQHCFYTGFSSPALFLYWVLFSGTVSILGSLLRHCFYTGFSSPALFLYWVLFSDTFSSSQRMGKHDRSKSFVLNLEFIKSIIKLFVQSGLDRINWNPFFNLSGTYLINLDTFRVNPGQIWSIHCGIYHIFKTIQD